MKGFQHRHLNQVPLSMMWKFIYSLTTVIITQAYLVSTILDLTFIVIIFFHDANTSIFTIKIFKHIINIY